MNINFKTHFPWPGPDGKPEPTRFREKILAGLQPQMTPMAQMNAGNAANADGADGALRPKLHTIRRINNGKGRFREGMKLTFSTGPRFTPERFGEAVCTDTRILRITPTHWMCLKMELEVIVDFRTQPISRNDLARLVMNDGLTMEQFTRWFLLDTLTNGPGDYELVHWTDLRY